MNYRNSYIYANESERMKYENEAIIDVIIQYINNLKNIDGIEELYNKKIAIDDLGRRIRFEKDEHYIEKFIEDSYGNRQVIGLIFNKELQAINKQVEELGWNDR